MFVHGVGLDRTMWDPVCSLLGRRARDLIRYDLVGHGSAEHTPGPYTLDTFVDQLTRVAPATATVVGFSLGALIAQGYAVRDPDRVTRLVLLNSVFNRTAAERAAIVQRVADVRTGGYAASVNASIERWFTPEFAVTRPDVIAAFRARLDANDVHAYANAYEVFATADAGLVATCRDIRCPTVVVTGEDDLRSTPPMTRALAAALPHGRAVVVPGVRHMLPVERADVVAALIKRETSGR